MAKISKAFLRIKVFVDSDVIISSLISKSGAANIIINNAPINLLISNFSHEELNRTVKRLGIGKDKLEKVLKEKLKIVQIRINKEDIINKFGNYTYDFEDAHIVAGAKEARAKFLVTFNVKDYKLEKIYDELGIRILMPGELLEYLRNLE